MAGYFELKAAAGPQFVFNLKAANHQVILTSETYPAKASAHTGIESVKKNANDDARYQRKTAKDNSPYFVLTATNGETLGKSEMYSSAAAMEGAASRPSRQCAQGRGERADVSCLQSSQLTALSSDPVTRPWALKTAKLARKAFFARSWLTTSVSISLPAAPSVGPTC